MWQVFTNQSTIIIMKSLYLTHFYEIASRGHFRNYSSLKIYATDGGLHDCSIKSETFISETTNYPFVLKLA